MLTGGLECEKEEIVLSPENVLPHQISCACEKESKRRERGHEIKRDRERDGENLL